MKRIVFVFLLSFVLTNNCYADRTFSVYEWQLMWMGQEPHEYYLSFTFEGKICMKDDEVDDPWGCPEDSHWERRGFLITAYYNFTNSGGEYNLFLFGDIIFGFCVYKRWGGESYSYRSFLMGYEI